MSKTRDTGFLANVIQVHDTGVRIMSGSNMLMAISSSGAVTITGELSGSDAANSLLLDGTGSLAFTTTASFLVVSASQQQISSSYIALSGSYNTFSGSASTRITVDSASLLQVSSSQQQISASLLNVISIFATTGSNSFRATQSITGSLTVTGQIIAQTLNVQQVTSSIIYSSGSNNFGCDLNSRQTFTGSVLITGSLTIAGGSSATSYSGATIFGSTIACSPIGCFATSCATSFIGGTGTLSGDLTLQGAVTRNIKFLDNTNTNLNAQIQYDQISSTSGQLLFGTNNAGTFATRLTISNIGAATFTGDIIYNNAGNQNAIITSGAANNGRMYIYSAGNADIGFQASGSSWFLNKLGIGAGNPCGKLQVVLPAYTNEDTDSQHAIFGSCTSGYGVRIGYNESCNAGYINSLKPGVAWSKLSLQGSSIVFAPTSTERVRVTTDGLTFNGDTAAANALDDYEEGDLTLGFAFNGACVGMTTSINCGKYTKIGRQVSITGAIVLTCKGSSTGDATVYGLPYLIGNTNGNYSSAAFRNGDICFTGQFVGYGAINSSYIVLNQMSNAGVLSGINNNNFINASTMLISFTYFT